MVQVIDELTEHVVVFVVDDARLQVEVVDLLLEDTEIQSEFDDVFAVVLYVSCGWACRNGGWIITNEPGGHWPTLRATMFEGSLAFKCMQPVLHFCLEGSLSFGQSGWLQCELRGPTFPTQRSSCRSWSFVVLV